jgi:hypothetical protein
MLTRRHCGRVEVRVAGKCELLLSSANLASRFPRTVLAEMIAKSLIRKRFRPIPRSRQCVVFERVAIAVFH